MIEETAIHKQNIKLDMDRQLLQHLLQSGECILWGDGCSKEHDE
jgi:hypothetical protein